MLQLATVAVEVSLFFSILIEKAIVFECLSLKPQKSYLIFEYLQKLDNGIKTHSAGWERRAFSSQRCAVAPGPIVLLWRG